ncbi:MAG: hypothetical protein K8S99_16910 [Planctomycetes bacterium]|nr:hypothetical protein [Planctomycetota bacterium]
MTKARWHKTRFVALLAGAAAVLFACEHAKYWRGGAAWDPEYVATISDPGKAHDELVRRMADPAPKAQTSEAAAAKSAGCITCHGQTDDADMHPGRTLAIGCADCHGGDATVTRAENIEPGTTPYYALMHNAHVPPRNLAAWFGDDLIDGRPFGEHAGHDDPAAAHRRRRRTDVYALLNQESPEFVRFINPGDLRVADFACAACHAEQVTAVRQGMMTHGAMLWSAALYNNGSVPNKLPVYGESYSPFGLPQELRGVIDLDSAKWSKEEKRLVADVRWPTRDEMEKQGVLPSLTPLPVWNIAQPGNILRIFERGTRLPVPGGATPNAAPNEAGTPNPLGEPGKPDKGLSVRGLGTLTRTDPVFLGLQKTRLLDPVLNFPGTNDHAGDFRASGCTACHTPYANDRDPAHSGVLAVLGNRGRSASVDPTVPKDEPGHPIKHAFTNSIPNSQCITCHIHPGTSYANSYLGYMWWDNESDGEAMYPNASHKPTPEQEWLANRKNPEGAQLRGLWGDLYPEAVSHTGVTAGKDFLERTGEPRAVDGDGKKTDPVFNDSLKHNQFADFHGHGWVFRAVFKKDRQGNMIDRAGKQIDPDDPDKWTKAVHLKDIHLERGMQCVDCHFDQDVHGNGRLYGETRNATEITCIDCHGTYDKQSTLRTSGVAAPPGGTDLSKMWVGVGKERKRRFEWRAGALIQRSSLDPAVEWAVTQTHDTLNPASTWSLAHPESAKLSRYAKTIRKDGATWGDLPLIGSPDVKSRPASRLAHSTDDMECYTCHTSWMTSCFGCHLRMKANQRAPMLHNENLFTRNYTQYNFQVLRDDVFMLGRDGSVKGGKIVPVRSSSAVLVSSQNQNREWVYHQQQTVSGEGFSGQAFNPHFPHATGGVGTTKMCSDCHLAEDNSNNAWMAQLLLQGTNFVNFMGRYAYVATGPHGLEAVAVTEHDEPQAVYGSHLHTLAYPDEFKSMKRDPALSGRPGGALLLEESHHHDAGPPASGAEILDLQLRGEYLYAARGRAGFYVFDIANIDNKGFSERIVTAPVSPLGQRLGFDTKNCVAVASPTTLGVDPVRERLSSDPTKPRAVGLDEPQAWHINREQPIHPMYAYLYIGDSEEGLILTSAATLLDGDPQNNFLERAKLADGSAAFNPGGQLTGLTHLTLAGHNAFVTSKSGLAVIDLDKPTDPKVAAHVGSDTLRDPRSVAVQFRYAFVTDADGFKVIDVTNPAAPKPVPAATIPLADAHRVYVARTWAFVADGKDGLAIIDVTNPEKPVLSTLFNDGGKLNDCRDVKIAMTNASLYAYVADGVNGLKVLELMGPDTTPRFRGFIPPLAPRVIAVRRTEGPALAISKPLDRDRAVDESGDQVAVFGRWGARPLNFVEMQRMYLRDGKIWTVTDTPRGEPLPFNGPTTAPASSEKPADKPAALRPGPRRPGAR